MDLSEKIQQEKKENFIKDFKNRYPEVYSWFNSYEFSSLFNNLQEIDLQIQCNRYGTKETNPALPFTDSNGVVPLEDIDDYLQIEGFDVGLKKGEGMYWFLTVRFRGE